MKNSFWFNKTTYSKFQEPKITADRIFGCQSFLLISLANVVLPKVNVVFEAGNSSIDLEILP